MKRSPVKNEARINTVDIAYYDVGSSVNYDKVLEADGYRWLSYLSFQGNRRYIPIEKLNESNSSVTPIVEKQRFNLPPSGTYTFSKLSFIKNEPKVSAATIATYGVGMSVNYDRLVDSEGKTWLSYISNSGVRRYIAIT
ncbi:SH3 domain-containing protein [Streptococcus sp. 121]|nr:SH3 domain-containing protein [Streptococcus sp. 121]